MMEVVLNRLRDFSCKTSTFECKGSVVVGVTGGTWRDVPAARAECFRAGCAAGRGAEGRLDIESALSWLRTELMEMRSQDQALIRQLMELHSGIQELKQELSEEELTEEEASGEGKAVRGTVRATTAAAAVRTPAQEKCRTWELL
ncbi:hypothetical protein WMY93_015585 [Mugilogobius chulae]|uniref:Uncharacterized protein n=1 Tax=Mugilogobius chulae TaxID=88201 RepID=A0AAW0NWZ7_9GOBI